MFISGPNLRLILIVTCSYFTGYQVLFDLIYRFNLLTYCENWFHCTESITFEYLLLPFWFSLIYALL